MSFDLKVCWVNSDSHFFITENSYRYVWEILQKCNMIFLQIPLIFKVDTVLEKYRNCFFLTFGLCYLKFISMATRNIGANYTLL